MIFGDRGLAVQIRRVIKEAVHFWGVSFASSKQSFHFQLKSFHFQLKSFRFQLKSFNFQWNPSIFNWNPFIFNWNPFISNSSWDPRSRIHPTSQFFKRFSKEKIDFCSPGQSESLAVGRAEPGRPKGWWSMMREDRISPILYIQTPDQPPTRPVCYY